MLSFDPLHLQIEGSSTPSLGVNFLLNFHKLDNFLCKSVVLIGWDPFGKMILPIKLYLQLSNASK